MTVKNMDYWRQFFKSTDADLCTVIENAIFVAAVDQPQELIVKRDRIAQRLFTPGYIQCGGCEALNLTDLRSLGLDNCMKGTVLSRAEDHNCGKDSRNRSPDSSSNQKKNVPLGSNLSFDEAEALTEEMEEKSQTIKEIFRIKEILLNPDESPKNILECLRRLELMALTIDALEATNISKAVIPLKSHHVSDIRKKARLLTRVWKEVVDAWCKAADDIAAAAFGTPSNSGSPDDNNYENGLPSPPLDEGAFTAQPALIEMSQFFDGMDEDGNVPLADNDDEGDDNEEEHKIVADRFIKNPQLTVNNEKIKPINKQSLSGENKAKTERKSFAPKDKNFEQTRTVKLSKSSDPTSGHIRKLNRVQGQIEQRCILQSNGNKHRKDGASLPKPRVEDSDDMDDIDIAMRYELSKRRLQDSYEQEKNAKKQRTIQIMDLHELPTRRPNSSKAVGSRLKLHNRR